MTTSPTPTPDIENVRELWPSVLSRLSPVARVIFDPSEPISIDPDWITVAVRQSMVTVARNNWKALFHAISDACTENGLGGFLDIIGKDDIKSPERPTWGQAKPRRLCLRLPAISFKTEPVFGVDEWEIDVLIPGTEIHDAVSMLRGAADYLEAAPALSRKAAYREYLKTPGWIKTRDAARDRAGKKCQMCAHTDRLEVHHNSYERLGSELDTDLIVLCRDCHKRHHGHI